jgi:hypothetical protein
MKMPSAEPMRCFVCHTQNTDVTQDTSTAGQRRMRCPRCGPYDVSDDVIEDYRDDRTPAGGRVGGEGWHILSGHLRRITDSQPDERRPWLQHKVAVDTLIEAEPSPRGLPEAIDELIRRIYELGEGLDRSVKLDMDHGGALVYARSIEEWQGIYSHSIKTPWIEGDESWTDNQATVHLTPGGWQRAYDLVADPETSTTVFVGMWFPDKDECPAEYEQMWEAWENGMEAALRAADYDPYRADLQPESDKICDEVLLTIQRSPFAVIDVTGARNGVYFEAGYALGRGRPVIWTCQKDWMDANPLPFNTRQYRHLQWRDAEDLHNQLSARVALLYRRRG